MRVHVDYAVANRGGEFDLPDGAVPFAFDRARTDRKARLTFYVVSPVDPETEKAIFNWFMETP